MKNHTTPLTEVMFRASAIGKIAQTLSNIGLSESQEQQLKEYELRMITPIGLSAKQQSDLDKWDAKINEGGTLTPKQMETRDDFKSRLTTPKGLTDTMQSHYNDLIDTRDADPELSKGAKSYIKEVWLWHEKGFRQQINSKYLKKGIQAEEDAINLISFVDDRMYSKNAIRMIKDNLTGECDVNEEDTVHDTKCVWNPMLFMNSKFDSLYEWQGRAYMYLYNKPKFKLRYCLVDCPPEVLNDEFRSFCWNNNIIDPDQPQYKPLIDQFYANMLYEQSGKYTREERVKTFSIERDHDKENVIKLAVKLALDYYPTITLNMIDDE